MDTPGNLVDSPTHRYGESFFEYEYLREFEAKIPNSVRCQVPLCKNCKKAIDFYCFVTYLFMTF